MKGEDHGGLDKDQYTVCTKGFHLQNNFDHTVII